MATHARYWLGRGDATVGVAWDWIDPSMGCNLYWGIEARHVGLTGWPRPSNQLTIAHGHICTPSVCRAQCLQTTA